MFSFLFRTFDFVESTLARENSKFFWFSAHLFVPLTSSKVLSLEKTQNSFGFLLAYSYLCQLYEPKS